MTTTATHEEFARDLHDRRRLVLQARDTAPGAGLDLLLTDIDAALERIAGGTYEECTVCHESIGLAHLSTDPLARCCVEHPTAAEASRIERDLALARRVQLGLLPPPGRTLEGWQFSSRYEAAGEVGGDFYDVIPVPARNETLVVVGDVSGKGIAASLMMASLVATFRSLSSVGMPTGELLARVNDVFHGSTPPAAYATLAALSLKPDGRADVYSAGHWPPLLRRAGHVAPVAVDSGLPLGLFAGSQYRPTPLTVQASDTLLVYTDGTVDAENTAGLDYGFERLERTLASVEADCLETLVEKVTADVRRYQDAARAKDDLLFVALQTGQAG